ncbi:MAG TPA: CBS domain-containing protein [Vicinamibacterales bacterium]|nr:CBS domain-containing protein [Vicinamibacterales bacterium]
MTIKEIMTRPVVVAPETATLNVIARLMWDHDCGTIPIVDDNGHLAGIVTDRDICMAAYTQGKRLEEIPVATAMARQVLSVHQNATVEQAEAIMRGGQVRRIPVLDQDRRPIGIVSVNDLARHAARARRAEVDREILLTVAAICQPHAHVGVGEMDHSTGAPIAV